MSVLSKPRVIDAETVKQHLHRAGSEQPAPSDHQGIRFQILKALEKSQGNRTHASALLGIDPSTLYRQIKKLESYRPLLLLLDTLRKD